MTKELTYLEASHMEQAIYIDVRSEGEYAESHIPGAFNVPIFNDAERAQVGTVYKQIGKEEAKDLGLQMASAKLPSLIREIRDLAQDRPVVVYCWRGGMRSRSISTILDLMGTATYRLDGGYRGYREFVTTTIANCRFSGQCILIHGMTGTGKSDLLDLLSGDHEPVIDLETMAGHKGSAFGAIGEQPNNQRTFDSLLVRQLKQIEHSPYFFMESESQRIGRVRIPEFLMQKKNEAVHVLLQASLQTRIQRLLEQYVIRDQNLVVKLKDAYRTIESKLPTEERNEGWVALEEGRFADFAEILLVHYYDPRYAHAAEQYSGPVIVLSSEDLTHCKGEIQRIAQEKTRVGSLPRVTN
jgi:tRNA 2-selenouridine synthase